MWIGIDDTDSTRGGCTTWVLTELLALAREERVDLIGEPRLVRLNPNIPWKTRGNAALSARFGSGEGPRRRLGEIDGRPVWSYDRGRPIPPGDSEGFRAAAWERVLAGSRLGEPGTDPAIVVTDRRLPAALYWRAVREVVPVNEVRALLDSRGVWWRTRGSERGLVGASASIAWPGHHPTWELSSYRERGRIGRSRRIDAESVRSAARRYPDLFLCHDARTRRLLVAPHTACPVLYGLRSTRPEPLFRARRTVRSEPVDRWVVFRTNQGTGDHLASRPAHALGPYMAARVRATVVSGPKVLPGGHVRLSLVGEDGVAFSCLAFEPTKTLPKVAAGLAPGDRLEVWGSRGDDPTFRLEGIRIVRLVPRVGPPRPPDCEECGRPTRSLGTGRGYRCPSCRRRFPPERAVRDRTAPRYPPGEYHPTPSARRHLAPRGPEERGNLGRSLLSDGG